MTTETTEGKEKITKQSKKRVALQAAEELLGDGNAAISRSRTVKLSVPNSYGTSIACSSTVTLSCNQDNKTMGKAAKLCHKMLERIMEEDREEMVQFVEELS